MSDSKAIGHTEAGRAITDELVGQLAAEAERGYDVDELVGRRGRQRHCSRIGARGG
jgi:hypothetical protein